MTGRAARPVATPARRVLWACIEDYAGLWELRWELNGLYGGPGADGHLAQARDLARRFLAQGWVEAYWCEEPYGELSPVAAEDLGSRAQLLDDDARWEAPEPGTRGVRLSATEAGEQAYAAGERR